MADTKEKGDIGELAVLFDLRRFGWYVAIPYGENNPFDLIAYKGALINPLRVQVKYCPNKNGILEVSLRTISNGKVSKVYTADMVDIIAVYDPIYNQCFYIPSKYFSKFKATMSFSYCPLTRKQVDIKQFSRMVG